MIVQLVQVRSTSCQRCFVRSTLTAPSTVLVWLFLAQLLCPQQGIGIIRVFAYRSSLWTSLSFRAAQQLPIAVSLSVPARRSSRSTMSASNNSNNNDSNDLPRIDGVETIGTTRWLKLETLSYTDVEGKQRKWDRATRTTKKSGSSADAVVIIPLLKRPYAGERGENGEEDDTVLDTLLVEQYRPPVGRATLEFPAGLIDNGETPEQAALRELREETGYVGEACKIPPVVSRQVCMTPGLADETVHCVVVVVDLDNPYNSDASAVTAEPDEGEHIIVHRVSLKDGFQTLLDNGSSPMAIEGLYLFALGLEIGKSMASNKSK